MLVVVSSTAAVADEAAIINGLFDEGLEVLHLRKPEAGMDELKVLLGKISPQYYRQIALHQHHEIADDFGINRLHFTELKRKTMSEEMLITIRKKDHILSTSIHQADEYSSLSGCFDYTFLGPVFDSISKRGYDSVLPDDFVFPALADTRVIAIGGVDAGNMEKIKNMGFDGAAVLGAIWQRPEDAIGQFKALQQSWHQTGR